MDTITKKYLGTFQEIGIKSPAYGCKTATKPYSRCKTCKCEVELGAVQCLKCLYGE